MTRPERVRVTAPHRQRSKGVVRTPMVDIHDQSPVGEVYVRSLMRVQFRLAVVLLSLVALLVGSLPLLFWAVPGLTDIVIWGVPLSWPVLGLAIYPVFVLLGWVYVRAAERNEDRFTQLVKGD